MAHIAKNTRGKWAAQINRNGQRFSKSFETKREAQAWAIEQEAKAKRAKSTGGHTFGDAVDKYLAEVSSKKAGERWERARLNAMADFFGKDTLLVDIAQPQIAAWRDDRAKVVSGSSIVREANTLRHMLQLARLEWHWIDTKPWEGVKLPASNPPRQSVWGWKDIKKVLRAKRTGKSAEMQRAFHLALRSGMRLQEVLAAPECYDPVNRVVTTKTKTEAAGKIPIGRVAHKLLMDTKPFTVAPNEGSVLFAKMCRQLLIHGLTFHDARATALTHLAKKVPVEVLAKISRHKDVSLLVNTYYRPKAADIAKMI